VDGESTNAKVAGAPTTSRHRALSGNHPFLCTVHLVAVSQGTVLIAATCDFICNMKVSSFLWSGM
jgi:hypothetical protein